MNRRIHLSVSHTGEAELRYIHAAFASNSLSTSGPNLSALETDFSRRVGLPSVALSNGTTAMHLAVKLLGLAHGDEVVTPTLTFAASCNPLLYERAIPIFIDSDYASWNLDPNLLARFLKKRARANRLPKAVMVVHLLGQSADLNPILEICRQYNLPLIEDAAESLGALYHGRYPGSFGDFGIYSFNGNKIITGTTGGMIVTKTSEAAARARKWSCQSRDPDPDGLKNYIHSEIGYNYQMSNVIAGIVLGQLEVLEERVQQRRAVFERYRTAFADLPGIEPQPEATFDGLGRTGAPPVALGASPTATASYTNAMDDRKIGVSHAQGKMGSAGVPPRVIPDTTRHTRWLSCFLIGENQFGLSASHLIKHLDAANIESRPVWRPMHLQPLYRGYEVVGGSVAADLHHRGICLPSSSSLTLEDQQFVIDQVRNAHFQHSI